LKKDHVLVGATVDVTQSTLMKAVLLDRTRCPHCKNCSAALIPRTFSMHPPTNEKAPILPMALISREFNLIREKVAAKCQTNQKTLQEKPLTGCQSSWGEKVCLKVPDQWFLTWG